MKWFYQLCRVAAVTLLICIALFGVMNGLELLFPFRGYDLIFIRLVTGFWFFLNENLALLSTDSRTWGPGLGAFLLATALIHRFLAIRSARSGRYWTLASSLGVALILPVLFVISFLVPGVLLQWEMLREIPWINVS